MKRSTYILALTLLAATGCSNSRLGSVLNNQGLNFSQSIGVTGPTGTPNYHISNVNIATPSGTGGTGTTGTLTTTIFFDTTGVIDPISNHCTTSGGSAASTTNTTAKSCSCNYTWQEVNATTGSNIVVPRSVSTPVQNVQPGIVTCLPPAVFATEITIGTVIRISVTPSGSNPDVFTSTAFNFTKTDTSATAGSSFQDSEGHAFDNIHRYSCYDQTRRGMKIINQTTTITSQSPTSTGEVSTLSFASKFCVSKFGATANVTPGCEGLPPPDISVQSSYYNLYIRNTDRGGINSQNDNFVCPTVKESLQADGTVGNAVSFWPMDTSFALSLDRAPGSFDVGVEAFSRLAIGAADLTSASSTCGSGTAGTTTTSTNTTGSTTGTTTGSTTGTTTGSTTGSSTSSASTDNGSGSLLRTCLGFAKLPNADGTCPFFKDSTGRVRLTYRLRRFIAIYPQLFDTDGQLINQAPSTDTIYVLDRPVSSPNSNPTQPFTMRGPKPCPFSWFDHKNVLGPIPQYAATNFSGWTGTNVDGIEFPHQDLKNPPDGSAASCSATMPIVSRTTPTELTLGTLNDKNPVLKRRYVRPFNAFAPHYEEDIDFKACAPQANPLRDPPLHFSKDPTTGNVAWCAEAYPTQNDNVEKLDVINNGNQFTGEVVPFTSHFVKNAVGPECGFSLPLIPPPAQYPPPPPIALGCPNLQMSGLSSCADLATNTTAASAANHPVNLIIGSKTDAAFPANPEDCICAPKTCDRTVIRNPATGANFPLLARASQVEDAIASDTTFGCILTFDNGGTKTGKSTPLQGCCGPAVSVWTGNAPITSDVKLFNKAAHLEPSAINPVPCLEPAY